MKKALSFFITAVMAVTCFAFPAEAGEAASLDISRKNISHSVSPTLYGAFIEDISKACDGGLVSNLVYNNSFEYNDTAEDNQELNESYWRFTNISHEIHSENPLNENNTHYERLTVSGKGVITNIGCVENWDYKTFTPNEKLQATADMGFKEGVSYDFSCYIKNTDFNGTVIVYLDSKGNSNKRVELDISNCSVDWNKVEAVLEAQKTEDGALSIEFNGSGTLEIDFVSLIPQNSYGYGQPQWKYTTLRSDLAQALIDLNPSFIRFPGGCFCEGDSLDNLYDWKSTIGPLEARTQTYNVWRNDGAGDYYINSNSMGYAEYFNLCDDIGAEPVPCVNVGLTCQGRNGYDINYDAYKRLSMTDEEFCQYLVDFRNYSPDDKEGMQNRMNDADALGYKAEADWNAYLESIALTQGTAEWDNYVQDVLDLIEFANGSSTATYWGAVRAACGHEEPYNLKYIQLGNENWGDVYWRNFDALYKAVKAEHPDITVITSAGTWLEGREFDRAWENAKSKYPDCYVDEHYYTISSYLYGINGRYDGYDRNSAKVFVGEYAATADGVGTLQTKSNICEAIEEAAYMTGLERNGDVVAMTAYAPTLAKINSQNWSINEIWFDSQSTVLTPSYYTQMLYANNTGTEYIDTSFNGDFSVKELAQSVTVDTQKQVIYVKLVNSSGKKQTVNLNLDGFESINYASNQHISSVFKSACNEVGRGYCVAPKDEELSLNGNTVTVEAEKYSVNVIRIAYGENDGAGLYQLPEGTPETHLYLPPALRVAIPCSIGVAVILIISAVVISKAVKKRKRGNNQ